MRGENHPQFNNWASKHDYGKDWNTKLKESIRKRDNYQCRNCNITEEEQLIVIGYVLHVHHIDYDKQNNNINNLITLCFWCHCRSNFNRDYWKNYYLNNANGLFLLT